MIKNILFDMGSVLIRFDPDLFISRLELPEAGDAETLKNELFRSVDWVSLDRGAVTEEQVIDRVSARVPERLRPHVEALVRRWDQPPVQMEGMEALVGELAEAGYGLYLLTNAGPRHREYWPKYPVSRYFPEERVFRSADYRLLKPEAAFYETALARFGLDRQECVFIDDNPVNAESAVRLGLDTVVFHGQAPLRRELAARGIPEGRK